MSKKQNIWDKIWRDHKGQVVIYQRPNWLIISWIVVTIVWLTGVAGRLSQALFGVGVMLLAAWAVLELLRGVNYFRRGLGAIVLLGLLALSPYIWTVVFS